MHVIKGQKYGDYWIACNVGGRTGEFFDAFTISKHSEGTPPHQLASLHQRDLTTASSFPTEAEAHASAMRQATEWIDAQK